MIRRLQFAAYERNLRTGAVEITDSGAATVRERTSPGAGLAACDASEGDRR